MNTRSQHLAQRRQQLIAQSIALRSDLALQAEYLRHPVTSIQVGLRVLNRLRRHPEWIAGAALALAVIKPRRLSSLLRAGTAGLRTWRKLMPALQNMMGKHD
jgi:hypothetical protein